MSTPLCMVLTASASGSAPDDSGGFSDPINLNAEAGGPTRSHLNVEIENTGDTDMVDMIVQLKDHPSGEWYGYLGATDYSSGANSNMLFATSSPASPDATGAGQKSHLHIRIGAAAAVRFGAQLASGTGDVVFRLSAAAS